MFVAVEDPAELRRVGLDPFLPRVDILEKKGEIWAGFEESLYDPLPFGYFLGGADIKTPRAGGRAVFKNVSMLSLASTTPILNEE